MSQVQDKSQIITTADLVRRGATVLQEACPKCGAVQIKYKGKVYCTKEDDLGAIDSPAAPEAVTPVKSAPSNKPAIPSSTDPVKKLLEEKLDQVSKQLESTNDVEEQSKLLDLISKYVETLEKLKKSSSQ